VASASTPRSSAVTCSRTPSAWSSSPTAPPSSGRSRRSSSTRRRASAGGRAGCRAC
jgi:hypothetical protein